MTKSSKRKDVEREKRNKIFLGIFITVLMVGSTAGFLVGGNSNTDTTLDYDGANGETYSFERNQGYFFTEIDNEVVRFYSHPLDVLSMNISDEVFDFVKNSKVTYFTFNPDSADISYIEQARFDLELEMPKFGKVMVSAVTKNKTLYNYDVITCSNATSFFPVFSFEQNTSTKAFVKDNCVRFQGKRNDFLKYRDLVIYTQYEVI